MQSQPERPPSSPDRVKELGAELTRLSHAQSEALLKAAYLNMSPDEAAAYDRRRIRIGEICSLLAEYKPL